MKYIRHRKKKYCLHEYFPSYRLIWTRKYAIEIGLVEVMLFDPYGRAKVVKLSIFDTFVTLLTALLPFWTSCVDAIVLSGVL